jgi:FkbH-like protein
MEEARRILDEARDCLDPVKLMRLGRKWAGLRTRADGALSQRRRVALLGNATTETWAPLLEICLATRGLAASIFQPPFGTWQQQVLDPKSALHEFGTDLAFLHLTLDQLRHWPDLTATPAQATAAAAVEADDILRWCEALRTRRPVTVVLANFHLPPSEPLSNLAARHPGSRSLHVQRVNLELAARAPAHVVLLDIAGLASRQGIHQWFDPVAWHHSKQPVSYDAMPLFVHALAALLASTCVAPAKCVVLDLDNTLWGGVVADDGLDGIRIGQGNAEGEAYQEFQRYLLGLRRRGILLAVCSKNQEAIAREAFEKHDQMAIRLSDISAFFANFDPKPDNLRRIAHELNLGLDALVFVDDNPVERDQVRLFTPEVRVPEIPADPAGFVRCLERCFLFETQSITGEDLLRAESYAANRQRAVLAMSVTDVGEYLRSLEMQAALASYGEPFLDRITQLINKSNQFNLCTRRSSAEEVKALATDHGRVTLSIRLRDRFGDNGLISAIHGRVEDGRFIIENWVMSCRVLDRGVEQVALNHLAVRARERGCRAIDGSYIPTPKNALVREHYRKLGFAQASDSPDGRTGWSLDLASFTPRDAPITLSP